MKKVGQFLVSGLIGISIGMVWLAVEILMSVHFEDLKGSTISVSDFLFWVLASFLIGVFFSLARFVFEKDQWSLRKQIVINFFICLSAWLVFNFYLNGFQIAKMNFVAIIGEFIIMYAIAYGAYIFNLLNEVKQINEKLKKKN
ncbi:MAG: DUF3021 domain-containing protein [Lactobacillus sp.]